MIDWTSTRIPGRAYYGLSASDLQQVRSINKSAFQVDWNITTGSSSVNSPVAVSGSSWLETTPNSGDEMFFGVDGSSVTLAGNIGGTSLTGNFFAVNNLYATSPATPTVLWAQTLSGSVDHTGVAFDEKGTNVYVVASTGKLYCFGMTSGTACSGFPFTPSACTSQNGTTETVQGSSPWVDYQNTTDIYYGDTCGRIHRVSSGEGDAGTAGHEATGYPYTPGGSSPAAFESSPLVLNGVIYIGDDEGRIFAVEDGTSPQEKGQTTCVLAGVGSLPCAGYSSSTPSAWAVRSSPVYDTNTNYIYFQADDYIFELTAFPGGNFSTFNFVSSGTTKHLNSGAGTGTGTGLNGYIMTADLSIDTTNPYGTNPYLYTSFNNYLFKVSYPFSSTTTIDKTQFSNVPGTNNATTIGGIGPYPYQYESSAGAYGSSYIWAGDATGVVERFDCAGTTNAALVDGVTSMTYGTRITSDLTGDYSSGDVIFGYTGGLVQYPLQTGYGCPSATPLTCTGIADAGADANTFSVCSGASGTDGCYQCCSNNDCPSKSCVQGVCAPTCVGSGSGNCAAPADLNAGVLCTSGVCVYACNSGYTNCSGTPQTSSTACTNTNSDTSNCGGCGTVCSNVNIASTVCSGGTCSGHCNDGYVHCSSAGVRQATGCETSVSCSACCGGSACAGGSQVCMDPGATVNGGAGTGNGTCMAVPTGASAIQAAITGSEGNLVSLECPGGQPITNIVFADYGLPTGTAGQSWENHCANVVDPTTSGACTTTTGPDGLACQYQSATGSCQPSTCFGVSSAASCPLASTSTTTCIWNSVLNVCTSNVGFLHSYGSGATPDTIANGYCAYDVASDIKSGSEGDAILGPCGLDNNGNPVATCAIEVANYNWGTPNTVDPNTANPPFPYTANSISLPWSDPCPNIPNTKTFAAQASCGACPSTPNAKRVFETNSTVQGNLSFTNPNTGTTTTGVAGADALCMFEAEYFGLTTGSSTAPVFLAWLSTTLSDGGTGNSPTGSGSQAFTQTTGPYVLVDNNDKKVVSANFATLITPALGISNDIDVPACGSEVFNQGTDAGVPCATAYPTGEPVSPLVGQPETSLSATPSKSYSWTGTDESGVGINPNCSEWTTNSGGTTGEVGNGLGNGQKWSAHTTEACSNWQTLFCFEQ